MTKNEDGLIYVKPAEGRRVRLLDNQLMPDTGMWVHPGEQHYTTLMAFGDLVEAEAPQEVVQTPVGPEDWSKLVTLGYSSLEIAAMQSDAGKTIIANQTQAPRAGVEVQGEH